MKLSLLIFFNLFVIITSVFSQQKYIQGKVKNIENEKLLAYVNIGIVDENFGTTSNEYGEFELNIPNKFIEDSLTFSFVGFNTLTVSIKDLLNEKNIEIDLLENMNSLDEVILISKKPKIKKIGIRTHNPLLQGSIGSKDGKDIIEFGQIIKLKNRASHIISAHLYLNYLKNIDSALVRINFYNRENGKPGKRIIHKIIQKKLNLKKGWIDINLEENEIYLEEDFFITYEILPNKKRSEYLISYGGKLGGTNGFMRMNSQGIWYKLNGAAVSTYVRVKQ